MTPARFESPLVRAYRELLNVAPRASAEDLKKAFHRVALIYHPDHNPDPDAARDFRRVKVAYETLIDPVKTRVLNENHRRERMMNVIVAGLNITVGSFFGHRAYAPPRRTERARRLGTERAGESDLDAFGPARAERDVSILDDPAFDAIEVVYAGKFSLGDEERLRAGHGPAHLRELPWVVLNNRGIAHTLDQNFRAALRCFEALDERVPNNIVFTYRRGLCQVVLGFTDRRKGLFGAGDFDRAAVERGLAHLRRAVELGTTRSIGKQKCLVIRKLIADVLAKLGRRRAALGAWREIARLAPASNEARARATTRFGLLAGRGRSGE